MAFPSVTSITPTAFGSAATDHNADLPATVDAGDLLIVFFSNDGSATVTTPSGWTLLDSTAEGTEVRLSIYAKDADGTEDGGTVNLVTSASEHGAAQVYRIAASSWDGTISNVVAATAWTSSSSDAPDPPSLTSGFGAVDTLWIAAWAKDRGGGTPTAPTSYTNLTDTTSGGGGAGASVVTMRRENNTATEDPGTGTTGATADEIVAQTVAIKPAGGATEHTKTVAATVTLTADLTKKFQAARTLAATTTLTPDLVKKLSLTKDLSATVTLTPSIVKKVGKSLAATVTLTANLTKGFAQLLEATVTMAANLVTRLVLGRSISATVTLTPDLTSLNRFVQTLPATVTLTPAMTKHLPKVLNATVTLTAAFIKEVAKSFNADMTLSAELATAMTARRTLAATATLAAGLGTTYIPYVPPGANDRGNAQVAVDDQLLITGGE